MMMIHYLLLSIFMCISSIANAQFFVWNQSGIAKDSFHVSAMYIMGDSSVDCGENTLFYSLIHLSLSLSPCSGSHTTLLPYLLAEKIGLPNPLLFYNQNGTIDDLKHGLNYGASQATIINPGGSNHQSLNQQLRQVLETFQLLQLHTNEENALNFIESSIFYLSFGRDDYIDLFLRNSSGILQKYGGQEFADILVTQMTRAVRSLYNANVRKVVCMGVLPLGCTPRMIWEWNKSDATDEERNCVPEINEFLVQYNSMMNERVVELNKELVGAQVVFCDVYQGMMEILTNPALYGFTDAENACCGLGHRGAAIGCISPGMACNRSEDHVWWDLYNPTAGVNVLLADTLWSGPADNMFSSICHPMPIQDLASTPPFFQIPEV